MKKINAKSVQTCLVKEARISYTDSGKGFQNVVLLHGFLENKTIWSEFVKNIGKRHRIITIDLPGHGLSEEIGYYHSMELMADVVLGVMKNLGLRRYFLVGHSMGGYVSLAFIRKHAAHIKGITLFNSTAYADNALQRKVRDRAIRAVKKDYRNYVDVTLSHFFEPEVRKKNEKFITRLIHDAQTMTPRGIAAAILGMKDRPNSIELLNELNIPVQYIAGENDKTIPLSDVQKQNLNLPNSTLVQITDCGHFGYLENPQPCIKALKKFIRKNI